MLTAWSLQAMLDGKLNCTDLVLAYMQACLARPCANALHACAFQALWHCVLDACLPALPSRDVLQCLGLEHANRGRITLA